MGKENSYLAATILAGRWRVPSMNVVIRRLHSLARIVSVWVLQKGGEGRNTFTGQGV